jgi:hypothetical protein
MFYTRSFRQTFLDGNSAIGASHPGNGDAGFCGFFGFRFVWQGLTPFELGNCF